MKRILALTPLLLLSLFTFPHDLNAHGAATPAFAKCYGRNPCRACKTCEYCKHCAVNGGTCGVCKPKKKE